MKNKILFVLICILTVISCRKDEISDGIINQPPSPSVVYQIDLIGSVVDQNGNALSNVQVSSGSNFVTTDVNGLFKINELIVDGISGSYVSADAEGYFSGGYRIYAQGTHSRQTKITLIQKELSGYVNSTKDETIALQDGLKIDFPANSFTLDGSDYQGLVSIYAYHLDPSEEGYLDRSPGDLSGTDEFNNNYVLESFGMIAVEMESGDGQKVQLKEGMPATITVPVDPSLLGDAPIELPLWHFDEDRHKWVKEGMAELIDGSYVGQVPHFSWWNCDDFFDSAGLCVSIIDNRFNGSMQGLTVEITSQSQGTSTGVTDTEGNVNGLIPANEVLDVTVYDICGNIVYSGSIGPFTGDVNKEEIYVTLTTLELHQFTGTVYDCEAMNGLESAIVGIEIGGFNYYAETNDDGYYEYFVLSCGASEDYQVTAFSIIDGSSGFVQTSGLSVTGEPNVVDINLCNESPFIVVNGELVEGESVVARRKPNETLIYSNGEIPGIFTIGFNGFTVGTFPAYISGTNVSSLNCTVTITQFDDVGGVIKGTMEGLGTPNSSFEDFTGAFVATVEE